ncbi:hypothetical protein BKA63DRAFT_585820 [Paraphoma chrysanthemicola]|nr:hypothetical protein BKA63DRAFT_585820 [Paraphoma chrysanthemicola]
MAGMSLQPLAYAVSYISFFFGTASFFLRFYSRIFILKLWGWDDWLAVVVLAFSIVQQTVLHQFLYWGSGLTVQQLETFKWLFIEEIVYYLVHWVIKYSFLLFYLRLSTDKTFRKLVFLGMGLNVAILMVNVLLACLQCIPFDEILHPGTHPGAKCINKLALLIVPSILNIITDTYILILPISTVWNLQMSVRRKIAVLSVIGFGACAVLIAICRLFPLFELNSSPDVSYILGKMVIVAALEIQFAIIAVNLPSMKALWMKLTGGSTSDSGQGYSGQKGYKLSSMERRARGSSGLGANSSGQGRSAKGKGSRGSITQLEIGTESEEELFRQSGTALKLPTQGSSSDIRGIKITTDVNVRSVDKQDSDLGPQRF